MQLITPILAAAAVPPRKEWGSAQNAGRRALRPIAAMVNIAMPGTILLPAQRLPARPAAAMMYAMAVCQRRSPLRSELHPTNSIAGQDTRNGIDEIIATWNELNPETL